MPVIERSARVIYSDQKMFDLVNDIGSYPSFMTGCISAEILSATEQSIEARLTLGFSGIQQSFITRNQLLPPRQMVMRLVEGPFRHFEGNWSFERIEGQEIEGQEIERQELEDECHGCKVSLRLDFAFKNSILGMTAGRGMEQIASRQVDALCQRADELYGGVY